MQWNRQRVDCTISVFVPYSPGKLPGLLVYKVGSSWALDPHDVNWCRTGWNHCPRNQNQIEFLDSRKKVLGLPGAQESESDFRKGLAPDSGILPLFLEHILSLCLGASFLLSYTCHKKLDNPQLWSFFDILLGVSFEAVWAWFISAMAAMPIFFVNCLLTTDGHWKNLKAVELGVGVCTLGKLMLTLFLCRSSTWRWR